MPHTSPKARSKSEWEVNGAGIFHSAADSSLYWHWNPPPTLRNRCVVTFYAGPVGLSLFSVPPPSQREAEQLAKQCWGPGGACIEKGGDTPCRLCLCYHCYPMVHTAFSSSSLFKVISVWLIFVCMGVILLLCLCGGWGLYEKRRLGSPSLRLCVCTYLPALLWVQYSSHTLLFSKAVPSMSSDLNQLLGSAYTTAKQSPAPSLKSPPCGGHLQFAAITHNSQTFKSKQMFTSSVQS